MELVITGHLLNEPPASRVFEHNEVAQKIEESPLLEYAFDHHLKLSHLGVGQRFARDRPPGLEPFPPGPQRANPRFDSIRRDQDGVVRQKRRELLLIGLELLKRRPDGRVLVRRALEL